MNEKTKKEIKVAKVNNELTNIPERGKSVKERSVTSTPKKVSIFKVIKYKIAMLIYKIRMRKVLRKRKYLLIKFQELKNLMTQIDSTFPNRPEKRRFWREFVKDGRLRGHVVQDLINKYQIPKFKIIKEK